MALALAPKGLKRICTSCGVRFFDLNKRPALCPSCGTEFTGDIKVRARRTRVLAPEEAKVEAAEAEEDTPIIESEDIVSLEEVETDGDDVPEDDIDDLDDDDDDDDDLDDDIEDDEE